MEWRLDLGAAPPAAPAVLDEQQRRVVEHRTGPLLVLAGPGTGKTTTIVEAICARLGASDDPLTADQVLGLTFGRKAAVELRDRVTARIGGGIAPLVCTFHSFAYALLRRTDTAEGYADPPRLLSGAEEDVRIRELLRGAVADGAIDWPEDLMAALPTLGLANEVRAVLARARELGMEGSDLRRIGASSGRPAWQAVGQLARQEQDVMVLENVMDYGELMYRAVVRAHDPDITALMRRQYRAIYVDEYQDTDPLQALLLRALAGPQSALVVVGDPDQAIYGFRGADVGGLLRFPSTFRTVADEPAPVVVLGRTRRFGPRIRAVATAALGPRLPAGLSLEAARAHRAPVCEPVEADRDVVTVRVYEDDGAQAAHVAREIRLAHVKAGVPWHDMAVLVRTGHQIPPVQRALHAAGVPVVVAADEIPLRSEPSVAALLAALNLAVDPGSASASEVLDVLTGPLVGLIAGDVRRLGRALRAAQHRAGFASPASDVLIRAYVIDPLLPGIPAPDDPLPPNDPLSVAVARLRALLGEAHTQVAAGAAPQEVLWTLWTGGRSPHGWPNRLRAAALGGSRAAHHDLDAVMALFDAAERLAGRYPGFLGVRTFIASVADQQIPAEPVADRGVRAEAVRVLTAHRAKGLEWEEVWVVGVDEGVWPDLRARGTALRAEELTRDGVGPGPRPADLLEEERRLFYVACTRARARLHVSAVEQRDGDRPSRFIADIAGHVPSGVEAVSGRPPHPVSLDGLVAQLRQAATDPASSPFVRQAAIERLATLIAERGPDGQPLVPAAHPTAWWGVREPTEGVRSVRDPDRPIALSGSGLDGLLACPLSWFLAREVNAETPRGPATGFGSIVHAVADFVAKGEVPASLIEMDAEVERVWSELRFEARWQSEAERREARAALERFLGYHLRRDRLLVETEASVSAAVTVPAPTGTDIDVHLRGFIDRVEADADGRLVAIDLKNMRGAVPDRQIPEHGQLGVYQLLLRAGGLRSDDDDPAADDPVQVGGAALVQLRVDAVKGSADPKVQFQPALPAEAPTWVEVKLGQAAHILRTEAFTAIPGGHCRYCPYRSTCPAKPDGEQVIS